MSGLARILVSAETQNVLPFPPPVFGAIALAIFLTLGLIMWSYRDVANRHPRKSADFAKDHNTHGQPDRTGADH